MTMKNEIEELKAKVQVIKGRLHALNIRISRIEKGIPASVLKASVDHDLCIGCGICRDVCPVDAIAIAEVANVNSKRCTGCGHCITQCPSGAITLRSATVIVNPDSA